MNEAKKMNVTEADHTPPPQDPSQVLSPRRRSALVTYLAILFAVAFLFVAIMMVAETKRLKTMNQELQDSSKQTSASLTSNINALQAENQKLSKENDELQASIETLEAEAEEQKTKQEELQSRIDALSLESKTLNEKIHALEIREETLTKELTKAVQVSELLQKALAANEAGDVDGLQELLGEIEPMKELLSATEQELYESLIID